jgi:hypothetical protein
MFLRACLGQLPRGLRGSAGRRYFNRSCPRQAVVAKHDWLKASSCIVEKDVMIVEGRIEMDEREVRNACFFGDVDSVCRRGVPIGMHRCSRRRPRLVQQVNDTFRKLGAGRLVGCVRDEREVVIDPETGTGCPMSGLRAGSHLEPSDRLASGGELVDRVGITHVAWRDWRAKQGPQYGGAVFAVEPGAWAPDSCFELQPRQVGQTADVIEVKVRQHDVKVTGAVEQAPVREQPASPGADVQKQ